MIFIQSGYTPTPDLNHSRIGINNITYGKTPVASSSAAGHPAIAATYPTTYEYWRPTSGGSTWTIDNGSPVECDYMGIVGTLSSVIIGCAYSTDGTTWITPVTGSLASGESKRTAMFLFAPVTARYWRLTMIGICDIAVVYIGKSLAMQRKIYQGHSPLTLSRMTETTQNVSETGQYLGRSITRKGLKTNCEYQHLKAAWYRANFDPFVEAARTAPFFYAWRPLAYPSELGFVWTTGDIKPTNSGPKDYMSVGFTVTGIANA